MNAGPNACLGTSLSLLIEVRRVWNPEQAPLGPEEQGKGHPPSWPRLIGLPWMACEEGPVPWWGGQSPQSPSFGLPPRSRQSWLTVGMRCASARDEPYCLGLTRPGSSAAAALADVKVPAITGIILIELQRIRASWLPGAAFRLQPNNSLSPFRLSRLSLPFHTHPPADSQTQNGGAIAIRRPGRCRHRRGRRSRQGLCHLLCVARRQRRGERPRGLVQGRGRQHQGQSDRTLLVSDRSGKQRGAY